MATGTVVKIIPTGKQVSIIPTVSTTPAYSSGDSIGGKMTISGALEAQTVGTILQSILIVDRANQKPQGDILIFNDDPAAATITDNAAFVFSTDTARLVARIPVATADYVSINSMAVANLSNLQRIVSSPSSSGHPGKLYAAWVTTSTPTFAATTDIMLVFGFVQSN